jgi:hypothetical protein
MAELRMSNFIVALLIAAPALFLVGGAPVHQRTLYTCLRCRAEQTKYTLAFVIPWYSERDITSWYDAHFPPHEHTWLRASCTRGRNIFGQDVLWACARLHPVCTLPPAIEREFAESANPATLAAFFTGLESPDRETQQQSVQTAWERVLSK